MLAVVVLFAIALTALEGWMAMLLIGVVHSEVPQVPALGFWVSIAAVGLVNMLAGLLNRVRS